MTTRTTSPQPLETWKHSADTLAITVVDGDGVAVDITGMTLRFVAHDANDPPVGKFQVADASIAKAGNVASVSVTPTETASSDPNWHWELWDITGGDAAETVIANGPLKIKPAVKSVG